jgi:hypothetical protein
MRNRKDPLKVFLCNDAPGPTIAKALVIMNDGFDILKTGRTLSLIIHDMFFMFCAGIWLPLAPVIFLMDTLALRFYTPPL